MKRASRRSETPSTGSWRPSAVTSSSVRPPSLKPIAVRGVDRGVELAVRQRLPVAHQRLVAADA